MRSVLLAVLACAGCETYIQHRAALVPHAVPVQTTGQPSQYRLNGSLGASNIADLQAPGVGNPTAGVAIPSRQFRGALGFAITNNFSFGWIHERGLASSAQPIKDTLPPLDNTTVVGNGPYFAYSLDTNSPLRIGLTAEFMLWSVPYVEYSTCIDLCPEPYTIVTHGTAGATQIGLGIVPSYRINNLTIFGGLTGRSHPTIVEKRISQDLSADVDDGPMNAIVHAGVAFDASDRVRFKLEMHQPITQDPVSYGPGIGLAFEAALGPPIPKPAPRVEVPLAPVGPPGAPPTQRLPTPTERAAAQSLAAETHTAAQAGECDRVRQNLARIRELDAETYAVAIQDKLIAYCASP